MQYKNKKGTQRTFFIETIKRNTVKKATPALFNCLDDLFEVVGAGEEGVLWTFKDVGIFEGRADELVKAVKAFEVGLEGDDGILALFKVGFEDLSDHCFAESGGNYCPFIEGVL